MKEIVWLLLYAAWYLRIFSVAALASGLPISQVKSAMKDRIHAAVITLVYDTKIHDERGKARLCYVSVKHIDLSSPAAGPQQIPEKKEKERHKNNWGTRLAIRLVRGYIFAPKHNLHHADTSPFDVLRVIFLRRSNVLRRSPSLPDGTCSFKYSQSNSTWNVTLHGSRACCQKELFCISQFRSRGPQNKQPHPKMGKGA